MRHLPAGLTLTLLAASSAPAAEPVELRQVVSRHHPHFDVARARLAVGRDGNVYLVNAHPRGGHVLRVSPDGRERAGGAVGYSVEAVAADAEGTVAAAESHFAHRVAFWGKDFAPLGHVDDVRVSDDVGWNAPSDVAAGPSGAFYAIDQYRARVIRVAPPDTLAEAYPLGPGVKEGRNGVAGLRADEARRRFVTAWPAGGVRATGFDGALLWSLDLKPAGEPPGAFDLDPAGNLYLLTGGPEVRVFDAGGKPAGRVLLKPEPARAAFPVQGLRVLGDRLVVKRSDPAALFELYDRGSGDLVRVVPADVEVLTVRSPSAVWTAGVPVPLGVRLDPGPRPVKPVLRVWMRPLGVPEFEELPLTDGRVTPPATAGGLYHLRVSPDVRGRAAEYTADGVVEVRAPGSTGTVSVFTPNNRFYYGCGEEIPVSVAVRLPAGKEPPRAVALRLAGPGAPTAFPVELTAGRGAVTIPAAKTAALQPGRYVLTADVPGFTVAPQHVEVGPGLPRRPAFHVTQYGDYSWGFPAGPRPDPVHLPRLPDLPEAVADHLARVRRLGLNLFADRLGHHPGAGALGEVARDAAVVARLKADPAAVAPEKAAFDGAVPRTLGGYGAYGVEEHPILLYMDAGLPLGTGHDRRPPEQLEKDLRLATDRLKPYPAFRGWGWAANWWPEKVGADAAAGPAERAAYEAAVKAARQTGAWAPVLDAVADRTAALPVEAGRRLRAALAAAAPGKVTTSAGPYRSVRMHPPAVFAAVDEVDLHYQAEQIIPPQVTPHAVDFYRRPGKPAWGHPEVWNDDGTGGTIFPALFQMAMRGADGVGQSGPVGPWDRDDPSQADPRSGAPGTTSAYRAAYRLLGHYGPWLRTLEPDDKVAVVVSARMQKLETWDGKIGGAYFDGLFEAYAACLYAHRPASFAFAEDLTPDTLTRYKAVLVVGQRVELEPPLAAALRRAKAAGVAVFHDGTCRPELVKDFTPLGVAFDRVRTDPKAFQDDAAYDRFPGYFKVHAAALREVLGPAVPPVAGCSNPEVLLTARRQGDARFVWAVNNTMLGRGPGLAWRTTLLMNHRVPVVETVTLDVPAGWAVYDVFARERVEHTGGAVRCDLRTVPARLYAVVPPGSPPPGPGGGEPADRLFGPHVRDLAVSPDGSTALLAAFNWDQNLYAIDPSTGRTKWQGRVGHAFAFDPRATAGGFAVQGFDVHAAEGYQLYAVGPDGTPARRFGLFGLPKRATGWASGGQAKDAGINAFAVPPGGGWVASAGDLGLVVWSADGKERWADEWWRTDRKRVRLVAPDDDTLIVVDGAAVSARDARTGAVRWAARLPDGGAAGQPVAATDGRTVVTPTDALGGQVVVVRDGRVVNAIPAAADEVAVSPDGTRVVAVAGRALKVFDAAGGLLWSFTGDDVLRRPRFSPNGTRVAVGSELGTLTVLTLGGTVLAERDLGALPVPAWLPGGDLLAATWMGRAYRFGPDLSPRWETALAPTEPDVRPKLLAADPVPAVRKAGWGNAAAEPLPLTPNLLAETKAFIHAVHEPRGGTDPVPWRHPVGLLTDGKPDAPPGPWLGWTDIGLQDSGWAGPLVIEVDTFRTRLRVTGVTVAEDPAHPESWLRDARLQWWDAAAGRWRDGPRLLSDAAVHSHVFDAPVEAARFRLVGTGGGTWAAGNLRLGELVFHGQVAGPSHPDAAAKRPVAVLFDEAETDVAALRLPGRPFAVRAGGAYSGGRCLELAVPGEAVPFWRPPYGHAMPNWDFEVAEHPKPGQYRYLQFAWKAGSAKTTGMSLLLGRDWPGGGVEVIVGDAAWANGATARHTVPGPPPGEWATVRVDLWALTNGKPPRLQSLALKAAGGGALFDQIVLGRTPDDLDRVKPRR